MANVVATVPNAPAVSSLVQIALEKGVDVEILERLVALQERVTDRDARNAFNVALAAFQAECPPLQRSAKVDYTTKSGQKVRFNFAPLDEIARVVRPVLAKHGLSYSWDSAVDQGNLTVTCTLQHIEGHSRTASFRCAVEGAGSPTMNAVQKVGSAVTYGERYSLVQVLGLTSADDDVDGAGGDEANAEPISVVQEADLRAMLRETSTEEDKFCRFLGIAKLTELPAGRYDVAVAALEQKRKARR